MSQNYHLQDKINTKNLADAKIDELPKFCHSFFKHLRADQYSEKTILNYACDLDLFFRFLIEFNPALKSKEKITLEILESLDINDLDEYKSYLAYIRDDEGKIVKPASGSSACRRLATLRSFYKFCQARELIKSNPMPAVSNPKYTKKDIIYLETDEISKLLNETTHKDHLTKHQRKICNKMSIRDYTIVLLLLSTGLRVSELVGIDLLDIDFNNDAIYVHRKGNKEQFVYATNDVIDSIKLYIESERKPKDPQEKALFLSNRQSRITVRSVERIVEKYANHPSVTMKHITPHKLRGTFGTNFYRETGDIYLTADALNHSSVATTAKHYSAQTNENRKKVKEIRFVKSQGENQRILLESISESE